MNLSVSSYNELVILAFNTPNLESNEEKSLLSLCKQGCKDAANKIAMSHLKLVISIAKKYRGYGLMEEDMTQTGICGLLKAIKNYDLNSGARFGGFSVYYIKSEIYNFIIDNWSMIKFATTHEKRKLFFNIKKLYKGELYRISDADIDKVSKELNVSKNDVKDAAIALSHQSYLSIDDGEICKISSEFKRPDILYSEKQESEIILSSINSIDSRSKYIIEQRYMIDKVRTREDIASELNVSQQRIAQIESAAIKQLKLKIDI